MIDKFYQILWLFAPFFIRKYLKKRAISSPSYLENWDERFGQPFQNPVKNCIWIHAVSVGENYAAQPLVTALKKKWPTASFLITVMTPTGKQTAIKCFPFAQIRYLPYDKKQFVAQFMAEHQPKVAIFMETEIWPNFLSELYKNNIPSYLVNARLSEKSKKTYHHLGKFIRTALNQFAMIFAQSPRDFFNFEFLGAEKVKLTGSLKFEMTLSEKAIHLAEKFKASMSGETRLKVVCASTRTKDNINEAFLLLDEWHQHRPNALLIIIPRHPESFEIVYQYACSLGFNTVKRSDCPDFSSKVEVIIGDSMGEMMAYYQCADVAFVGGSLVDTGCQNILEPIFCQVPTVFGYSTFNFESICQEALASNCAKQVLTPAAWYQTIEQLLASSSTRVEMSLQTVKFITKHQGVADTIVAEIAKKVETGMVL